MRTVRPFNIHHAFITAEAIQPVLARVARCEVALLFSLSPGSRGVRLAPSSTRASTLAESYQFRDIRDDDRPMMTNFVRSILMHCAPVEN